MSGIGSGKRVKVTVTFEVPVGMAPEQVHPTFLSAVNVRGDALSFVRQIDVAAAAESRTLPMDVIPGV